MCPLFPKFYVLASRSWVATHLLRNTELDFFNSGQQTAQGEIIQNGLILSQSPCIKQITFTSIWSYIPLMA